MKKSVDVLILGGGPAGASTALSLSRMGYVVVLVERRENNNIRIGETLHPNINVLLNELGIWRQVLADKHLQSFGIQSAWGHEELYENNFIFNPFGNGWHLDRARFNDCLIRLAEKEGTTALRGTQIIHFTADDEEQWNLKISIHNKIQQIHAKFLVDATGRAAFIARKKRIKRIQFDHLIGIVAFVSANNSSSIYKGFTLIESAENGWWYSAKLPGSRTVIAFMTDADIYSNALRKDSHFWMKQLKRTIYTKNHLNSCEKNFIPQPVAANSFRLQSFFGSNWLAVGDAAMAFDPLSGQGIYKALESGIKAGAAIHQLFKHNRKTLEIYSCKLNEAFEEYLASRKFYYLKEKRWSESLFWQRRHFS